jgi:hypothetical protein
MGINRSLLLAGLSVLSAAACYEKVPEDPVPPDMMPTLIAFESPRGQLDAPTLQSLGERLRPLRQTTATIRLLARHLHGLLDAALAQEPPAATEPPETSEASGVWAVWMDGLPPDAGPPGEDAGPGGRPSRVRLMGSGFLRITHRCGGWNDAASAAGQSGGGIFLTATFDESGASPVIWGNAYSCRIILDGTRLFLDGELNLHLGDSLRRGSLAPSPLVLQLAGDLSVDGALGPLALSRRASGSWAIRVCLADGAGCRKGRLEHLLRIAPDREVVVVLDLEGRLGVRVADDDVSCDLDETGCSWSCRGRAGVLAQVQETCS